MTAGSFRVAATSALVAVVALGIGAASANAAPLSMTFTEARANVGLQLSDDPLFAPPATAPFEAEIDPGSGLISEGSLQVPQFSTFIEEPIEADVTVDFDIGEITGSFNETTGALSLSGTAGGTLAAVGEGQCTVSVPDFLTVTTGGNSGGANPRSGVPFVNGLTGAGAIATTWAHMDAVPVTPEDEWFCGHVENQIGGPGGVWLQHQGDVVAPAAPQLTGTAPASPNPSGAPRILGAAEAGSKVSVYASPSCAGLPVAAGGAAELAAPGIAVAVAEGVTATFSATATDAAGNVSACSAPIGYTRPKAEDPDDVDPPACVVPKLVGKTLRGARRALKRADCKLGTVKRPRWVMRLKPRKRPALVVKSSSPRRGASPADRKVDLRLGPKPRKSRR